MIDFNIERAVTPAASESCYATSVDPVRAQSARVLSSLLAFAGMGADAGPTATALLQQFGTVGAVMHAPSEVLQREFALPVEAIGVMAASLAVHRATLRERLPKKLKIASGSALRSFLSEALTHRKEEVLLCLFLDNDYQLLATEEIATGTVNRCPVTVRQIVERALKHGASAVILAHNHPSGRIDPSADDEIMTQTLKQTLGALDIDLVEHVIVGDGIFSILSQTAYA
jgi:DNA repair protein RadC